MKKQGFTTIEFLVVLAVIAVLTAVVYSSFSGSKTQSRDQKRVTDLSTIQLALETYYLQNRQYPTSTAVLASQYIPVLPTPPSGGLTGPDYVYNYTPLSTSTSASVCSSYHLWTTFEQANQYLQSKKGFDSTSASVCTNGTDYRKNASTTVLIYDVTP